MSLVRAMNKEEYNDWMVISTLQQAKDRASVTHNSLEEEYEDLKQMLPQFLPDGMNTVNHYFYVIDTDEMENAGLLWFGKLPNMAQDMIFLFDIHLHENARSKGYGRKALEEGHQLMKEQGYHHVLLNVLKSNYAYFLYESMGYQVIENQESSVIMKISL